MHPARAFAHKLLRAAPIALAMMMSMAPFATHAQEVLTVQLNEATTVALDGNPSTGYSWQFDEDGSESANLVQVEDLGYAKRELAPGERPVLGAPSKYQFRVTGIEVGTAKLVFKYVRGHDTAPAKMQIVSIEVMGE